MSEAPSAGTTDGADPAARTVVIVDDKAELRVLLRSYFERTGRFTVVAEAGDGREALQVCAALAPDVVMLDLSMPEMDGVEALPLLRDTCPDALIVIFTDTSRVEGNEAELLDLGAAAVLRKGLKLTEVVATVETLARASGQTAGD